MISSIKVIVPVLVAVLVLIIQISDIESKSLPASNEQDTDGGVYQPMSKPLRINTFFDEQSTCIIACDKCAREDPHYFKTNGRSLVVVCANMCLRSPVMTDIIAKISTLNTFRPAFGKCFVGEIISQNFELE